MDDAGQLLWGSGSSLDTLQMTVRGLVVFLITLALIRAGGRRSFGQRSAFDNCVVVLLGAVLSRAVVGASPFLPTLAASAAIIVLHRAMAYCAVRWPAVGRVLDGAPRILVRHGVADRAAMRRGLISDEDLHAALRRHTGSEDFARIERAVLEKSGEITIVTVNKPAAPHAASA